MVSEQDKDNYCTKVLEGLNPYCSGIWSRRNDYDYKAGHPSLVLILIVVEYGLGVNAKIMDLQICERLNPYCSGIWSRR